MYVLLRSSSQPQCFAGVAPTGLLFSLRLPTLPGSHALAFQGGLTPRRAYGAGFPKSFLNTWPIELEQRCPLSTQEQFFCTFYFFLSQNLHLPFLPISKFVPSIFFLSQNLHLPFFLSQKQVAEALSQKQVAEADRLKGGQLRPGARN